ncbi:MAG: hypothetical protein EAX81_02000 [Candidatus Thorarchaeota archaeon]|nr:hypothetical protein [Candidatus Thorarchaeota archaeon]
MTVVFSARLLYLTSFAMCILDRNWTPKAAMSGEGGYVIGYVCEDTETRSQSTFSMNVTKAEWNTV